MSGSLLPQCHSPHWRWSRIFFTFMFVATWNMNNTTIIEKHLQIEVASIPYSNRHFVGQNSDPSHRHILINSSTIFLCCLGIGITNAGWIYGAITRGINTSIDVIHSKKRVHFLHFRRRQDMTFLKKQTKQKGSVTFPFQQNQEDLEFWTLTNVMMTILTFTQSAPKTRFHLKIVQLSRASIPKYLPVSANRLYSASRSALVPTKRPPFSVQLAISVSASNCLHISPGFCGMR